MNIFYIIGVVVVIIVVAGFLGLHVWHTGFDGRCGRSCVLNASRQPAPQYRTTKPHHAIKPLQNPWTWISMFLRRAHRFLPPFVRKPRRTHA
jgi:hypothetical protein